MQYLIKKYNKVFLIGLFILFLPMISLLLNYIIDIIYNLGVSFGSISRYAKEGLCILK